MGVTTSNPGRGHFLSEGQGQGGSQGASQGQGQRAFGLRWGQHRGYSLRCVALSVNTDAIESPCTHPAYCIYRAHANPHDPPIEAAYEHLLCNST